MKGIVEWLKMKRLERRMRKLLRLIKRSEKKRIEGASVTVTTKELSPEEIERWRKAIRKSEVAVKEAQRQMFITGESFLLIRKGAMFRQLDGRKDEGK